MVIGVLIVAVIYLEPQILLPTTPWWKACVFCAAADADEKWKHRQKFDVAMSNGQGTPKETPNQTYQQPSAVRRWYVSASSQRWLHDDDARSNDAREEAILSYLLVVVRIVTLACFSST